MSKYILKNKDSNDYLVVEGNISSVTGNWEIINLEENSKNGSSKKNGNGQGSLYFSETLQKWVGQYTTKDGKRKTMTQKNTEGINEFKKRYREALASVDNGTYIEKNNESIVSLAKQYINNKHSDGTTSNRSYKRELETLQQLEKTCANFCNIPIQKVTIAHIEAAKKDIKKYSNGVIDKIWQLLKKVFAMACSPSRRILIYNIMLDENLKKPISEKKSKKVKPLTPAEFKKLNKVLDNEERNHPYRNIAKMQSISGMRIGEVLARSKKDYNKKTKKFNIHNTLTQDANYNVILGEHTKTYNKKTQVDEGQRYLPLDNKLFEGIIDIIKEQCDNKVSNIYDLLFWDYEKNTFITPNEVNNWLGRLNKKYKISKDSLTTHRLRHYALTYWKTKGLDLSVIQYLAGHVEGSDITESVYIDVPDEYIDEQLKKIN